MTAFSDDQIRQLHAEAPLTDVHVHPAFKAYLLGRSIGLHLWSGGAFDPLSSRADLRMLERGGVGVVWSALYPPERSLYDDCLLLRLWALLFVPRYRTIRRGAYFDVALAMMDFLERELVRHGRRAALARSVAELEQIRRDGKIAFVHTVEGGHVLGGDPDRVGKLAARGVAMLTLAHFYRNDLVTNVDGIPRDFFIRRLCRFDFRPGGTPPLTELGREVLRRMTAARMLVDLTHCTPEAREAVYLELGGARPLMASHVGVRALNDHPYNLSDDDLDEIARSRGLVGVIFMPHWLDPARPREGLDAIWRTLEHIHDRTGSWDYVALGTDFDGFTDPPDDVRDASQLPRVTRSLLERGVPVADVKKILGGNALRVLREGWR